MALVDLKARLLADPTGFQAGVASAERSLNSFEARTRNSARGFSAAMASMTAGLAGLMAAFAPLIVGMSLFSAVSSLFNQAREFESAMGVIEAASGATGSALRQAEQTIRELGLATGFGAREAASAAEELLKAGLSVAELEAGALQASMTLAAATGGTMADGASIAVRAMRNFNVGVADLESVVQGAAGVINATTFGLQDYSLALGMAGNTAASAGITLEDFNATIALTAVAFSSGSDAGTSFKTFLQRLGAPTAEARRAMRDLHFAAYDANGSFVGMEEVARRLQASFINLTEEQRANAVVQIFGADAQRTANVLIDQGAEALVHMRDVTLQGADANAMAAARWQGVNGALANLSAKWQELAITLGGSGVQDFFARAINLAGDFVTMLTRAANLMNRLNGGVVINDNTNDMRRQLLQQSARLVEQAAVVDAAWLAAAASGGGGAQQWLLEREIERLQRIRTNIAELQAALSPASTVTAPVIAPATQAAIDAANRVLERQGAGGGGSAVADSAQRETEETYRRHLERMRELSADGGGDIDAAYLERMRDMESALVEMFGETERTLADQFGQVADTMADSLYNGLEQAFVTGDWSRISETLKRDFMQVLWDVFVGDELRDSLRIIAEALKGLIDNALSGILNGGAGGGGFMSSVVNFVGSLFGGRAIGGPVSGPVIVGEHGPELFDPHGGSGNIVPLTAGAQGTGGGVTVVYSPTIDARGVDAAQVARLEAQQKALLENLDELVVASVNDNYGRRKIG